MNREQGHILVIDDDPLNLLRMARDLQLQGHTLATANDGPQALEMLRAQQFDVVLLDLIMPEMDGRQVLKEIKQDRELRDIPVIIISALDEVDSVVECIEQGAEDYLTKPFNSTILKARLNASLGKKRLRDLETAYLQQELALRQSEKLATLGTLSAGMAHELNNPAAAAQRGVGQLHQILEESREVQFKLGAMGLSTEQLEALDQLNQLVEDRNESPRILDPLTRSDREAEIENWLDERGVADAWAYAPTLVDLDLGVDRLLRVAEAFTSTQFPMIIGALTNRTQSEKLLDEIGQGTARISEVVKALKSYTYLDQAPMQRIDVHNGLDDTLVMLDSKIPSGVIVHRDYAEDLPPIQAFGSELNQVWTNMIDNAIAAINGQGELALGTHREEGWLVVQIKDTGSGIPQDIQPRIFDPFFTTKAPGQGVGLGLTISHEIIVEKHGGRIALFSKPGETLFEIRLPLDGDRSHPIPQRT